MEQTNTFQLLLNYKSFPIPSKFDRLTKVSADVYNKLIFNSAHQYDIKSEVSEEVLKSYIKYWIDEEIPSNININNFYEYYNLSQEFGLLNEIIEQKKEEFGENLKFYHALMKEENIPYRSEYEEQISEKLDEYLEHHGIEMMKLPFQTLYNIFNHQKRNLTNHNLAYNLIQIEYKNSNNPKIFILLTSLDGTKLNKENFEDSIRNRSLHFNFIPQIEKTCIDSALEKQNEMEKQLFDLKEIVKQQQMQISQLMDGFSAIKINYEGEINDLKEMIKNQERELLSNEQKSAIQINEIKHFVKDKAMEISNTIRSNCFEISNLKNGINEIDNKISMQNKIISKNKELFDTEFSKLNEKVNKNDTLSTDVEELKAANQLQSDKISQIDEYKYKLEESIKNHDLKINQINSLTMKLIKSNNSITEAVYKIMNKSHKSHKNSTSTDQANSSPSQSKQISTPKNTQSNSLDDNNQSANPTNNYYNFLRKNTKDSHSSSNIQELSAPEINQQNYRPNNQYSSYIHQNYSSDNPFAFNHPRPSYYSPTSNYSKELNDDSLSIDQIKDEEMKSAGDARFYPSGANPNNHNNVSNDDSDSEEKKRYTRPKTRYYTSKKRVVDPNSDF